MHTFRDLGVSVLETTRVVDGGDVVSSGVWIGGGGVSSVCRRREFDLVVAQLADDNEGGRDACFFF